MESPHDTENTDFVSHHTFNGFVDYMRRMLDDIAGARVGPYINAGHMQEAAIAWNPGDGPGIDGYPNPDNITKIETEPYPNTLDCGNYHFKEVLCRLLEQTGLERGTEELISQAGPGQFECNMHSGSVYIADEELADAVYIVFIRAHDDLGPHLAALKDVEDETLRATCRAVLEEKNYTVEENPAAGRGRHPHAAPGITP